VVGPEVYDTLFSGGAAIECPAAYPEYAEEEQVPAGEVEQYAENAVEVEVPEREVRECDGQYRKREEKREEIID